MPVFVCSDCSFSDAVTTLSIEHTLSGPWVIRVLQIGIDEQLQGFVLLRSLTSSLVNPPRHGNVHGLSLVQCFQRLRCALRTGTSDDFETFDGIGLLGLIFHLIGMFKNVGRFFQLRLLLDDARSVFLAPRHWLSWRHGLRRPRIQGVIIEQWRNSDRTPEPVLH